MSNQQVRQSELFSGEDWTVLYRAFTQINFNAYDPPSINTALKEYLQIHYPEDFNDWIESSEFVAVIDLLSWLAGSLAFRMDINARENFLDTAKSRESVLRLAKFLSYNPRRSHSARGLVKVTRVSTTENVFDSMGINLQNQRISWNDTDNPDWFEHFTLILNAAMPSTNPFGIPYKRMAFPTGDTQLYRLNTKPNPTCAYSFSASVEGETSQFEVVNVDILEGEGFIERAPKPDNSFHLTYRNDGRGNTSERTGFFLMFKQGKLLQSTFDIVNAVENRVLDINQEMINETDVWVQSLSDQLSVVRDWTKVPAVFSDNITFSDLPSDNRFIFSVSTKDNDKIAVRFSDGRFGNVPVGNVRVWYRVANGRQYDIKPKDMDNITVSMPYVDVVGRDQTLTVTFSLQETVANAVGSETLEQIKRRAPQVYGTQNRMVSGEDYNVFPLSSNQIVKLRAVNRVYSGHSRFIDINDPTSTYQDVKVLAEDGILYRENCTQYNQVALNSSLSNDQLINTKILPMLREVEIQNYMEDQFVRISGGMAGFPLDVSTFNVTFINDSSIQFNSKGKLKLEIPPSTATTTVKAAFDAMVSTLSTYLIQGAKVKFKWYGGKSYRWAQIQKAEWKFDVPGFRVCELVVDDVIPDNALMAQIVPQFRNVPSNQVLKERFDDGNSPIYSNLNGSMVSEIAQLKYFVQNKLPFSLYYRYDVNSTQHFGGRIISGQWIAQAQNAVVSAPPNSVEIMRGQYVNDQFWVLQTMVGLRYVFESETEMRWPWLENHKVVDGVLGTDKRDTISVLWADHWDSKRKPVSFDILGNIYDPDGYPDSRKVVIAPSDADDDGEMDDPASFDLVSPINWKFYRSSVVGGKTQYTLDPSIVAYDLSTDVDLTAHVVGDTVFAANRGGVESFGSVRLVSNKLTVVWDDCETVASTIPQPSSSATAAQREAYRKTVALWGNVYRAKGATSLMATKEDNWLIYRVDEKDTYRKNYPVSNVPVVASSIDTSVIERVNADQVVFLSYSKTFKEISSGTEYETEQVSGNAGWYYCKELHLMAKADGTNGLLFKWNHYAGTDVRIDPSPTNIIDAFVLTTEYDFKVRQWLKEGAKESDKPEEPTALDLANTFGGFDQYKMFSDEVIWRPVKYKMLFGQSAQPELRASFKVVKLPNSLLSDGEIRTKVIDTVNDYFDVNRWEFGETFFYTELAAYVHMKLATAIASIVIVPLSNDGRFGNLFEVRCASNEMFLSTAQVSDVVIIDGNTMANLRIK